MAFNITDITSAINARGGLAKPSHFFVTITPPRKLVTASYAREAMFFCDTATLPGMSYSSQNIRSPGYGTTEKRPFSADFNDVTCTFLIDSDGKVMDFFQKWMVLINNWGKDATGVMAGTDLGYGEFAWPEEYEGTIDIHYFDPVGREIMVYKLIHAFPVQLGDVSVGWEQNDSLTKLPVVFAYQTWDTKSIPASSMDAEEAWRMQSLRYAQSRVDIGLMYSYGLHLLQNGRRSPLSFVGAATTFANLLL
ncbi:tail tube protein [uncultured Caudovirales phage]|uniref:Tail tube protein n=1 Tax=uncultured Caudovirales phage TaxID=2100421 RepID=A0A6J7WWQ9_9CAUD|nr:tail tube protein [uncultured Caudovirales phage]